MFFREGSCKCKYEMAFQNCHTPMLMVDLRTGDIDDANLAACNYYKYPKEEFVSMNIQDISVGEVTESFRKISPEGRRILTLKQKLSNGEIRDVEVSSRLMKIDNKDLVFLAIHDGQEQLKLIKEQELDKAYFDILFNNSPEAIAIVDKEFRILDINENFKSVFQYSLDDVKDKDITQILCEEKSYCGSYDFREAIANGKFIKEEVRRKRKNGELVDVLLMGFPLVVEGEIIGAYCIYSDITDVKKREMEIETLKNMDNLTGLYNKNYFVKSLKNEIENNHDEYLAVLVIGINEYNEINEALGQQVGDEILKEFAQRLKASIEREAVIARLNKDEFVVSLPKIDDLAQLKDLVNKVRRKVENTFIIRDKKLEITPSIGIAIYPDDGIEPIGLLGKAGIAMRKSREIDLHNPIRFEYSLAKEVQEYFWIKTDLRQAISRDELFLNYQPIYNTVSNELIGVEALLRWNHGERGIIPPGDFIPIAEKTGLIHEIGRWVLLNACRQNKEWQDLGYKPIYISVNVSVLQLEHEDFYEEVMSILCKTGLNPKYLQLEITETFFTQNYKSIVSVVKKLSNQGVRFAIDDFGTGYSSLGQLCEININNLKIDRMFIDGVEKNINKSKIVKAVISLAESLNINLTAEGVETVEQLVFLKENRCTLAQGFLFSKPVENDDIIKLLRK